jgi:hypothetical protein
MKNYSFIIVSTIWILLCNPGSAFGDTTGRVIDFLVEDNGQNLPQTAMVQDGKISVRQVGGDPDQDILFDTAINTLFIIDHLNKSYYRIDQNVIDKVSSMIDSLSTVAESQQGVLSDLMETLGLGQEEEDVDIDIRDTGKTLSAANIECRLFREYRNGNLESELCIASEANLSSLGDHYNTLNSFYEFGDQLINRAGSILTNMGMIVPDVTRLRNEGLPILLYISKEKIKTGVVRIKKENSASDNFTLPSGYIQTPIPFIG